MKRYPARVCAYDLAGKNNGEGVHAEVLIDGKKAWVPARAQGYAYWKERWKLAWAVFTGRADALFWPGQED